jgi:hypothetical protein
MTRHRRDHGSASTAEGTDPGRALGRPDHPSSLAQTGKWETVLVGAIVARDHQRKVLDAPDAWGVSMAEVPRGSERAA